MNLSISSLAEHIHCMRETLLQIRRLKVPLRSLPRRSRLCFHSQLAEL